jgi:hypothetical protein
VSTYKLVQRTLHSHCNRKITPALCIHVNMISVRGLAYRHYSIRSYHPSNQSTDCSKVPRSHVDACFQESLHASSATSITLYWSDVLQADILRSYSGMLAAFCDSPSEGVITLESRNLECSFSKMWSLAWLSCDIPVRIIHCERIHFPLQRDMQLTIYSTFISL